MSSPNLGRRTAETPRILSAEQLTEAAAGLHDRVRTVMIQVDGHSLHDERPDHEPSVAEQLGHLAQSLSFHAEQLDEWAAGRRYVVGRPQTGDADELDAVEAASRRALGTLLADLEDAACNFQQTASRLTDAHLEAWLIDVAIGRCPAVTFVSAVLEHAVGHALQLADVVADTNPD